MKKSMLIWLFILIISTVLVVSCIQDMTDWFDKDTQAIIDLTYEDNATDAYVGKLITADGIDSVCGSSDTLSYTWSFTEKPEGSLVTFGDASNVTKNSVSFTPDKKGTYVLSLYVIDDDNDDSTTTRVIVVKDAPTGIPDPIIKDKTSSSVSFSWIAISDATEYYIYRAESEDGLFVKIGSAMINSYVDTSVEPGKQYWYKVSAANPAGESDKSNVDDDSQTITTLPIPGSFQRNSNTLTSATLSWDAVANADYYLIEISRTSEGDFSIVPDANLDSSPITSTSCTISNLEGGGIYYFKIKAHNDIAGDGDSSLSPLEVELSKIPPEAPTNLRIESGTQTSLSLVWDSVSYDGLVTYLVYRSTSENGSFIVLNQEEITDTTFIDDGLLPGTKYYYYIISKANNITSQHSSIFSRTTIPNHPEEIVVTDDVTSNSVKVQWQAIKNNGEPTVYKVGYSQNIEGNPFIYKTENFLTVSEADNNIGSIFEKTISNLSADSTYYFTVKACNILGDSTESPVTNPPGHTLQLPIGPPGAPTNVWFDSISENGFTVYWNEVSSAIKYKIYINGNHERTVSAESTLQVNINNLSAGTKYCVQVSAVGEQEQEGSLTPSDSQTINIMTLCSMPEITSISARDYKNISLAWSKPKNAFSYSVLRADNIGGPYIEIESKIQSNSYEDSAVHSNCSYWYRIYVYNQFEDGNTSSVYNNPREIATPNLPKPKLKLGRVLPCYYLELNWDDIPGAIFEVKRDNETIAVNLQESYFKDQTDFAQKSSHTYTVIARDLPNGENESSLSITIPSLSFVSPTGGSYAIGTSIPLKWERSGPYGEKVSISYKRDNGSYKSISSSTDNSGSYPWNTTNLSEGIYNIRIQDLDTALQTYSPLIELFIPPEYSVSISSLNNKKTTADTIIIKWTKSGTCSDNIKLRLYNGSSCIDTISCENTGSYSYALPNSLATGSAYKIRLVDGDYYFDSSKFSVYSVHDGSHNINFGLINLNSHKNTDDISQTLWITTDEPTEKIKFTVPFKDWTYKVNISADAYQIDSYNNDEAPFTVSLENSDGDLVGFATSDNKDARILDTFKEGVTYTMIIRHLNLGGPIKMGFWIEVW